MQPISEIYCPKCNSRKITTLRDSPLPRLVSMDDLQLLNPAQLVPLVLRTATWRATCDECGYYVTYESY